MQTSKLLSWWIQYNVHFHATNSISATTVTLSTLLLCFSSLTEILISPIHSNHFTFSFVPAAVSLPSMKLMLPTESHYWWACNVEKSTWRVAAYHRSEQQSGISSLVMYIMLNLPCESHCCWLQAIPFLSMGFFTQPLFVHASAIFSFRMRVYSNVL